jgi:hypothetical protein
MSIYLGYIARKLSMLFPGQLPQGVVTVLSKCQSGDASHYGQYVTSAAIAFSPRAHLIGQSLYSPVYRLLLYSG